VRRRPCSSAAGHDRVSFVTSSRDSRQREQMLPEMCQNPSSWEAPSSSLGLLRCLCVNGNDVNAGRAVISESTERRGDTRSAAKLSEGLVICAYNTEFRFKKKNWCASQIKTAVDV